ncbi:putative cinnamoyl-CoA reductase [Nemania sp. FL0916]|nr:putative cinnamoyl-CoA reductase [Nemania sp. FL0916]
MAIILITGATGLIGFRILLAALDAGHRVRYTVRSEAKAETVSTNLAVQKLLRGDSNRLSSVVIPDFTVNSAFDSAMKDVTHVIHAGSPVPRPTFDPDTEVFQPTVQITSSILAAALKSPSVRRVVITSSIVCNLGPPPLPTTPVLASHRLPVPDPLPSTFSDVFDAYVHGKMVELHQSDEIASKNPHFTISHVVPGYVFGRNELMRNTEMMTSQNSSNNFLMMGMLAQELPFPIHGGFVHIDDVADTHLKVAFLEESPTGPRDFGIASKVDYGSIFDIVQRAFPKATAEGVFKAGRVPTLPVAYDSGDAKKLLGTLRGFEDAVIDVAGQYLEMLGKEKE